jgi:hypothetical protein
LEVAKDVVRAVKPDVKVAGKSEHVVIHTKDSDPKPEKVVRIL